jgi:hypothetical protein
MVTGDNVVTARAIARECGIVTSDSDIVIEGPVFRKMSPAQVDAILPRLKVMARSSPKDKNWLVRRLVRPSTHPPSHAPSHPPTHPHTHPHTHTTHPHTRLHTDPHLHLHTLPPAPTLALTLALTLAHVLQRPRLARTAITMHPQNGNLPKTKEEWELEHLSNEYTWDTPATLYQEEGAAAPVEAVLNGTQKIQDTVMPGYLEEWESARKVRVRRHAPPLCAAVTACAALRSCPPVCALSCLCSGAFALDFPSRVWSAPCCCCVLVFFLVRTCSPRATACSVRWWA